MNKEINVVNCGFVIEDIQENDKTVTRLTNLSNYVLTIYMKPLKPRRKIDAVFVIDPNNYILFEYKIDKSQILIGFTEV